MKLLVKSIQPTGKTHSGTVIFLHGSGIHSIFVFFFRVTFDIFSFFIVEYDRWYGQQSCGMDSIFDRQRHAISTPKSYHTHRTSSTVHSVRRRSNFYANHLTLTFFSSILLQFSFTVTSESTNTVSETNCTVSSRTRIKTSAFAFNSCSSSSIENTVSFTLTFPLSLDYCVHLFTHEFFLFLQPSHVWFDRLAISKKANECRTSMEAAYEYVNNLIQMEKENGIPPNRIVIGNLMWNHVLFQTFSSFSSWSAFNLLFNTIFHAFSLSHQSSHPPEMW